MVSKQLDIGFYEDGLSVYELNCLDIPLAVACGAFGREKYYLYLMQLCLNANWCRTDKKIENMFECLHNIGLKIEPISCKKVDLISKIQEQINLGYPVLLPVAYAEMFFSSRYQRYFASHYLLVDGYVEDYKILLLREELSSISAMQLKSVKGLYPLRLKYNMVEDIWEQSQPWIEEWFKDRFFVVKPYEKSKFLGREDFLAFVLDNYNFDESLFINAIMEKKTEDNNLDQEIRELRNAYHKCMYAFFNLLDSCIKNRINVNVYSAFVNFKKEYLEYREIAISKFHVSILKKQELLVDDVIVRTKEYDENLKKLLSQILQELSIYKECNDYNEEAVNNLALKSIVSASSCEDYSQKGPINVIYDDLSIWKSNKTQLPHWVCFDFSDIESINQVIITHHPEAHKITKDFCIQGSIDGVIWENLEIIENNFLPQTVHDLDGVEYRFIRIYITMPALHNNAAIIRHVTIL